jgi:eukaryotic-like serine/threonine-protein kinase
MAPEQARGEAVTTQADVWAFGCILFEMLTGRRTWAGRTVTDVIAALVAREPEWSRLPPRLHPRVRFVLERCLEKDPGDRYRAIADVRIELAKALNDPDGSAAAGAADRVRRRPAAVWVAAAAVALGGIAVAGAAGWLLKPESVHPIDHFILPLPESFGVTTLPPVPVLAVSRDDTRSAFSTGRQMYLRSKGDLEFRPLQGATAQNAVFSPTFSPDAAWLAYVHSGSATGTPELSIRKIPVTGGTPETVVRLAGLTSAAAVMGIDVNWDDRHMLTWVQPEGIMQVSANGGEPELVVRARGGEALASPQILPGGNAILFTATRALGANRWDAGEIVVQALGSGERTAVWRGGRDARYVPTGHIVYAQGSTLFAVPFDLGRRTVTGGRTPLMDGLPTVADAFGVRSDTAHVAVSDEGALFYLSGGAPVESTNEQRTLAWVDREGRATPLRIRPNEYTMARISPDGGKVALVVGLPAGTERPANIWVHDLATEVSRQLTFNDLTDDGPVWTPESNRLYFRRFYERLPTGVYSVSADGGEPTRVAMSDDHPFALPWSLSPDGRTLALVSARTLQEADLATLDLAGEGTIRPLLRAPPSVTEPAIAPNGHWITHYSSGGTARPEISMRPFPDVTRPRYPVARGSHPVFSRDGSELFFFDGEGGPGGSLGRAWDVDPRTGRFLMIRMPDAAAASGGDAEPPPPIRLNVVLNWLDELKRRVPAR